MLKLDPKSARAYASRGEANEKSGDVDAALADYSLAIEIAPSLDEAYGLRGRVCGEQRDYERAIADESKAIELNPDPLSYFQLRRGTPLS